MKITNLVAQFSFFYQVYYIFVYLTIDPREGNWNTHIYIYLPIQKQKKMSCIRASWIGKYFFSAAAEKTVTMWQPKAIKEIFKIQIN